MGHSAPAVFALRFKTGRTAVAVNADHQKIGQEKAPMVKSFEAGDIVQFSGVYRVVHANNHIQAHYVTALSGDTFPN